MSRKKFRSIFTGSSGPSYTVVKPHVSTKRPAPPQPGLRPIDITVPAPIRHNPQPEYAPDPTQPQSPNPNLPFAFVGRLQDIKSTTNFLRAFFIARDWTISLRALAYMEKHHAGQTRRDGQPYIVHPLSMVSHALSINDPNITDPLCAVLLLHDICEETQTAIEELPFPDVVKNGVKYMSIIRFDSESKYTLKQRYYNELLESKKATIGKGFDRYNNLSTMSASFTTDKIRKNVVETDLLLLPTLKRAEDIWPEASNLLRLLRISIRGINDIYAIAYKVKLTDKHFINPPDAKDYSHLLIDAT